MLISEALDAIMELATLKYCGINSRVRIHIGNQLYDIDHIDTVIDMDTNKPNIVIHIKDK